MNVHANPDGCGSCGVLFPYHDATIQKSMQDSTMRFNELASQAAADKLTIANNTQQQYTTHAVKRLDQPIPSPQFNPNIAPAPSV